MNSKTLLFNKSIIKSDLRRFWWVSALESIAVFITCVLPMLYNNYDVRTLTAEAALRRFTNNVTLPSVIWIVIFAAGTAIMLYSYLYNAGSVSCIHGLPLKRKTLYFSHAVTGFVLLIIPVILNSAIFCLLKFTALDINYIVKFGFLLRWIAQFTLYTAIVFSGTIFVSMLTGNAIASLALTGITALLPVFALLSVDFFLSQNFYGYYSQNLIDYAQYIYIEPTELMSWKCLIYIAGSFICLMLGYWLYEKRKLENYGEVLAFNSLKPLFVFCAAVCSGMLGYIYFKELVGSKSTLMIFAMIPFGFIGLVIAHMLAKKAFTLKGILKYIFLYTGFVCAVFSAVKYDITGFEKYIPPVEEIESVSIVYPNSVTSHIYHEGEQVVYNEVYDPKFTDAEDIANVVALHNYKIINRQSSGRSLPIIYTLKDGSKVYRAYSINFEEDKDICAPVYASDVYKKFKYPVYDGTKKTTDCFRINYMDNFVGEVRAESDMAKIEEALKKDIQALKFDDYTWVYNMESDCPVTIEMSYWKDATTSLGTLLTSETKNYRTSGDIYQITDKYKNTLKVLDELGIEYGFESEDVEAIGINIYNYNTYYEEITDAVVYETASANTKPIFESEFMLNSEFDGSHYDYVTTNPEKIKEITDFAETAYKNKINNNSRLSLDITFHTKDNDKTVVYYTYITFGYEDMPQVFQDVVNSVYGG